MIPRALTLGIDFLQENGPGATQLSISRAVGTKGWILPEYTVAVRIYSWVPQQSIDGRGL